jgi:hypothetical protein
MGLTTQDDATQFATEPLVVMICLTGFELEFPSNPAANVSGPYSTNFDWTIGTLTPLCLKGTQNTTLFGTGPNPIFPNPLSAGEIKVSLKVPNNFNHWNYIGHQR